MQSAVGIAGERSFPSGGLWFYKTLYVPLPGRLQESEEEEHSIILAEVLSFKTSLSSSQLGGI